MQSIKLPIYQLCTVQSIATVERADDKVILLINLYVQLPLQKCVISKSGCGKRGFSGASHWLAVPLPYISFASSIPSARIWDDTVWCTALRVGMEAGVSTSVIGRKNAAPQTESAPPASAAYQLSELVGRVAIPGLFKGS